MLNIEPQADYLLALNCTQMQGYYFSRPVPVEEFEKLVYIDNPRNPFAKGHDSYLDIDKSEI